MSHGLETLIRIFMHALALQIKFSFLIQQDMHYKLDEISDLVS